MIAAASSALSGMMAQFDRVNMAAANLAGQGVTGALPGTAGPAPYQPGTVVTTAQPGGGVRAEGRAVSPGVLAQYDPTAPYANSDGMVGAPNVDTGRELTTLVSARAAYRANLAVSKVSDDLTRQALNLTA